MSAAVLFDCDSTLSAIEGIDLLARRAGVYEQVAPLTRAAMDGTLTLDEVYRRRLELIRPDRDAVSWLGEQYVEHRVTGAEETVATLQALGRTVHIVSSGIRQAVLVLADRLGIPTAQVHAVDLRFDERGGYCDFDAASPLCRSGGKAEICRRLLPVVGTAVMIGDGVTDLETTEAGVPVIAFCGVVRRKGVAERASAFVDAPTLTALLDMLVTPAERAALQSGSASSGGHRRAE